MANNYILQEVLDRIEAKYGDLNNERGCSVYTENGYVWLSVADIVQIIERVDAMYNDED
jgi:hypothetical protein